MRVLRPAALAALLVLSPGRTPRVAGAVPAPTGAIQMLEITSLTRDRASMWARALLPEAAQGSRQTFEGEVAVANVPIPVRKPVVVAIQSKGGQSEAVFFLDLDLPKTPEALLTKAGSHAIDLTLRGTLLGEKGSKAPVCAVGLLRLGTPDVHAPSSLMGPFIRFGGARLKGVSLTETHGEASAVLYNPLSFAVPVREISYSLYVGDRKLCAGSRTNLLIHPGRENDLSLPVDAGNADLIAAAGIAIAGGGTLEGRLVGSITFKAGRDEITLPVDLPGQIRVLR